MSPPPFRHHRRREMTPERCLIPAAVRKPQCFVNILSNHTQLQRRPWTAANAPWEIMSTWLLRDLQFFCCFLFICWFVYCETAISTAVTVVTNEEWLWSLLALRDKQTGTKFTISPLRLMKRIFLLNHIYKHQRLEVTFVGLWFRGKVTIIILLS